MKYITLLIVLLTLNSYSQDWSIGVYQDIKLAVMSDDYGNDPFTLDIIGKAELFFEEDNLGKFMIYPQVEYADLAGGEYLRVSGGGGYTFGLYDSRMNASVSANWGLINRFGISTGSFEFQGEVNVRVAKRFRVGLLISETQRTDIGDVWRFNSYVGVKYSL